MSYNLIKLARVTVATSYSALQYPNSSFFLKTNITCRNLNMEMSLINTINIKAYKYKSKNLLATNLNNLLFNSREENINVTTLLMFWDNNLSS